MEPVRLADEDCILAIYQRAKDEMRANHIYQWNEVYPDRSHIHLDICQKNSFKLTEENKILAAVVLKLSVDQQTLELQRLVTNGAYSSRGLASRIFMEAFKMAEKYQVATIRSSTNHTNFIMIHLFEKFGFERVGEYVEPQRAQFGSFITFERKGNFDYGNYCNGQPQYRYGYRDTAFT